MKKLVFLLAIAVSSLILFSCEDDIDEDYDPNYTHIRYRVVVYANLDVYNYGQYTVSDIYPVIENLQGKVLRWNDVSAFEGLIFLEKEEYLGQTMTVSFYVDGIGSAYYEDERQILIEPPEGYDGEEYLEIVFTVPDS